MTNTTLMLLRQLKLTGMADALTMQQTQPNNYDNLSFEERLQLLVDAEHLERGQRKQPGNQANRVNRINRFENVKNTDRAIGARTKDGAAPARRAEHGGGAALGGARSAAPRRGLRPGRARASRARALAADRSE